MLEYGHQYGPIQLETVDTVTRKLVHYAFAHDVHYIVVAHNVDDDGHMFVDMCMN